MRRLFVTLAIILLSVNALPAYGGDSGTGLTFKALTGDIAFDATLGDLNIQTQGKSLSDFISNLSASYNVPKIKITALFDKIKMTAADVYMTVGIAIIIKKPVDVVVKEYKASKGKGWGVIAKNLGIKPGSKEFRALKNGGSAELEKAKGRGKAKSKKSSPKKEKGKKK